MSISKSVTREEAFEAVVNDMHKLYNYQITDVEARQAARNLISFCKILVEMDTDQRENILHVKTV